VSDPSESATNVVSVLPKDAIQRIDAPAFGEAYFGNPDDDVLVVAPDDAASPARAYPIRILNYHEVVTDAVESADGDADPIAVTWCPICGSGVVYDAPVDGRRFTFGNSQNTPASRARPSVTTPTSCVRSNSSRGFRTPHPVGTGSRTAMSSPNSSS